MKVQVSPTDVDEYCADSRGRITLGSDYGDKKVVVAVLEVKEG